MSMQEIETKIMGILSVKKCRSKGKLPKEEQQLFDILNDKYRINGKLIEGSFFINSNGAWEQMVKE